MTAEPVPAADAAERAVLGAILINAACLGKVRPLLLASDFRSPRLGAVYASMLAIAEAGGRPDDPIAVEAEAHRRGFRDVHIADLAQLFNEVPYTGLAVQHALLIVDASRRRALLAIATEIVDAASGPTPVPAIIRKAREDLTHVEARCTP